MVLDVGLGAGSNALAARTVARALGANARHLAVVSFERSLAALELCLQPAHAADFGFDDESAGAARALLAAGVHTSAHTTWRLVLGELPATLDAQPAGFADVVFWDPFSPRADPALWSMRAFAALHRVCRAGATVHTYSGATAVRAAMLLAGFAVGAGGRTDNLRETTIASVDVADLSAPLDRRWLERLARSSAPFPADAPPDALARIAACPQFAARAATPGR